MLRKLILETLLLERLKKEELLAVVPGMENYEDLINKLNPKYYDKAAQFIKDEDVKRGENDYVLHGEIIFALLQHQKYSSTNLLAPEVKDIMRLKSYDELKKGLEAIGVPNRKVKDRAQYDQIKLLDRQVTEKLKSEEQEDYLEKSQKAFDDHIKNSGIINVNKEVKPGLTHLVNIDDWQVLLPSSIRGSQSIGVQAWCTVYSGAWETYTSYGDTLYYCIKDGKDYETNGYGFDYNQNPYDYVCIGFNHANEFYIPSGNYEQSVWGNQQGVTRESLNKVMGNETAEKLLSYLKLYQDRLKKAGPKLNASEQAEQQAKLQAIKDAQQNATNLTVFMQNEKDTRVSANELIKRTMMTLDHPNIAADVSTWIYKNYFLDGANNFKISKSTLFSDPLAFKGAFISAFLKMHGVIPEEIKNDLAFKVIDEISKGFPIRNFDISSFGLTEQENNEFKNLKSYLLLNSSILRSSLWGSKLSREVYQKMIDSLHIEEIDSFQAAISSKLIDHEEPDDLIYLILDNLIRSSKKEQFIETFIDVMEENYRLGKFDDIEFLIINQSNGSNKNKRFNSSNRAGYLKRIFEEFLSSPDCDEEIKTSFIDAKSKKLMNASLDNPEDVADFKYTGTVYKDSWNIDPELLSGTDEEIKMLRELSFQNDKIFAAFNGSIGGSYDIVVRQFVDDVMDGKINPSFKIKYQDMARQYIKNHNLIYDLALKCDISSYESLASRQYGPLITFLFMLPKEEFFSTLQSIKGFNMDKFGGNMSYVLRSLVNAGRSSEASSGAEKRVDIFDYVMLKLSKLEEYKNESKDTKRMYKSFAGKIGEILHCGYNGGQQGNNPEIIRDMIKNHTDVAVKCALYHIKYADFNDKYHLSNSVRDAFQNLINRNVIEYNQAISEIKNFNKLIADELEKDVDFYLKEYGKGVIDIFGRSEETDEKALRMHKNAVEEARRGTIGIHLSDPDQMIDDEDEYWDEMDAY